MFPRVFHTNLPTSHSSAKNGPVSEYRAREIKSRSYLRLISQGSLQETLFFDEFISKRSVIRRNKHLPPDDDKKEPTRLH